MQKSVSVSSNFDGEVCPELRKKRFGAAATAKEYRASFVLNAVVDDYPGRPEDLMAEAISSQDRSYTKVPKTLNFREKSWRKVSLIAARLKLPESEVLRRIVWWTLREDNGEAGKAAAEGSAEIFTLQKKLALLQEQIAQADSTLKDIMLDITLLADQWERK